MMGQAQTTVERYQQSMELAEGGETELALSSYRRMLQDPALSPRLRARVLSDVGVILFGQGQLSRALDHFLEAVRHDRTSDDARTNLEFLVTQDFVRPRSLEALESVRSRYPKSLPASGEPFIIFAVQDPTEPHASWPGWSLLSERCLLPIVQVGIAGGPDVPRAMDARGLLSSLALAGLLSEARLIVTVDPGQGALARALGITALILGAEGLHVDGHVQGEQEDDIARIPIERVSDMMRVVDPDMVLTPPSRRLPRELSPYVNGQGIELDHGGHKLIPAARGIDHVRISDADRLGEVDQALLVPAESVDFVLSRSPRVGSSLDALLRRWIVPLAVGGHLVVLPPEDDAGHHPRLERAVVEQALGELDHVELVSVPDSRALVAKKHRSDRVSMAQNSVINERELIERKEVLTSVPTWIEVSSTIVCNINTPPCVQCWKHADPNLGYLKGDQAHLKRKHFDRIAPHLAGTSILSLHGIGEPLANPHLFEYIEYADADADVFFVSNGLLLTEARIDKILGSKLARIDFSLDAATPETYRKIRHHDFEDAVSRIRRLVEERDRRGLQKPRVWINMTLMRENVEELPDFIRLAKEIGADHVHAYHMNQGVSYRVGWFDYEAQHCENDPETHDRSVAEAFRVAEELGVVFEMTGKQTLSKEPAKTPVPAASEARSEAPPTDSRTTYYLGKALESEGFFCPKPWTSALVDQSGNVHHCCWQSRTLGSLEKQSFEDIWNGPLARDIRRSTAEGVPHPACAESPNVCPWLGRV